MSESQNSLYDFLNDIASDLHLYGHLKNEFWIGRSRRLLKAHLESNKTLSTPVHLLSLFTFNQLASNYIFSYKSEGAKLYQFLTELPAIEQDTLESIQHFKFHFDKLHILSNDLYCSYESVLVNNANNEDYELYQDIARFNGIDIESLKSIYFFKYHFNHEDEVAKNIGFITMFIQDTINKIEHSQAALLKQLLENRASIIEHCFNQQLYLSEYQ